MNDEHNSHDQADIARVWAPALKEAGIGVFTAAVILGIFYGLLFRWIHPEFTTFMDRDATKLVATGKDLIPVSVGGYRVQGSSAIIEDFNGDEAILALPRAFQAEDYPFIKVNLRGFTRYSKFKILWRQATDRSKIHALEFNRSGDEVTQIAMVYGGEAYSGLIESIALLFYDGPSLGVENNNGKDIVVENIEFRPFSAYRVAEQVAEDWTNPPSWRNSSINVVKGAHHNAMISPNLLVHLLTIAALSMVLVARRRYRKETKHQSQHSTLVTLICVIFLSWALLEVLRWHWRAEQTADLLERYQGYPLQDRVINNESRCARFTKDCKAELLPYF